MSKFTGILKSEGELYSTRYRIFGNQHLKADEKGNVLFSEFDSYEEFFIK